MSNPTQPDIAGHSKYFEACQEVQGASRRSGPGYTVWRDWSEEDWIEGIVHYDSYNGSEEIVPCVVVGIYLDAPEDMVLGLLIQKRLQDGLKDRFLIPLPKLLGLIDLTNGRAVTGDPSALIKKLLAGQVTRLTSVATATAPVRASAYKYAGVVTSLVQGGIDAGLEIDDETKAALASLPLNQT